MFIDLTLFGHRMLRKMPIWLWKIAGHNADDDCERILVFSMRMCIFSVFCFRVYLLELNSYRAWSPIKRTLGNDWRGFVQAGWASWHSVTSVTALKEMQSIDAIHGKSRTETYSFLFGQLAVP